MIKENIFLIMMILFAIYFIITTFIIIKQNSSNKKSSNTIINNDDLNFSKTFDDLMIIINYKAYIAYQKILVPLIEKSINSYSLINDKIVNKLAIQITEEIISELSEPYKEKLMAVYKEEKINDVILELVYNSITEMSLEINKKTIKKMHYKGLNSFRNIEKKDM